MGLALKLHFGILIKSRVLSQIAKSMLCKVVEFYKSVNWANLIRLKFLKSSRQFLDLAIFFMTKILPL